MTSERVAVENDEYCRSEKCEVEASASEVKDKNTAGIPSASCASIKHSVLQLRGGGSEKPKILALVS